MPSKKKKRPTRTRKTGAPSSLDETFAKMLEAAKKFKAGNVKPEQLARAGGAPDE